MPMKLSAYVITFDSGFAPNPFGRYCTLACCKPTIRRKAEPGDIIIASTSSNSERAGCLVYAMRVKEVIQYQKYWHDSRFASRKPTKKTAVSKRGDNIWHQDASGRWHVCPEACHNESHSDRDISGVNSLVATEFFYFGRDAIPIPSRFAGIQAETQGHKNTRDLRTINRFWAWLSKIAPKQGRIGYPSHYRDNDCRRQAAMIEKDDIEES